MNTTNDYIKVLIFEHPPINKEGIGKTLYSFFYLWPKEKLGQVYSVQLPTDDTLCNYYYFKETGTLAFTKNDHLLNHATEQYENKTIRKIAASLIHTKAGVLYRSQRFSSIVKNNSDVIRWIKEFNPDCIFYGLGENIYENELVMNTVLELNIPLVTYISDDYLKKWSRTYIFRRYYELLFDSYNKLIDNSAMTVVISEVMRDYYANLFPGNNYYIARNAAHKQNSKKEIRRLENNSSFTISYTGNLELGRWKILAYLAKALKNLNEKNKSCKVFLNIYSQIRPSDRIIKNITNEYSKYLGNVSGIKLNDVRLNSDILLFVESFNPRYKEILESALSTKVPEYLSYGRNILAIAPPYSWSLQYLHNNNAAYCIKNVNEIGPELEKYLKKLDQGELQSLIDNGLRIFLEKHEFNSNAEKFKDAFDKSISKWKRKNESCSD